MCTTDVHSTITTARHVKGMRKCGTYDMDAAWVPDVRRGWEHVTLAARGVLAAVLDPRPQQNVECMNSHDAAATGARRKAWATQDGRGMGVR